MQNNNPMKNKEIALKAGEKRKTAVIINGIYYNGLVDAAKVYGITPEGVAYWCKKGKNNKGEKCEYVNKNDTIVKNSPKAVILDGIQYFSIRKAAEAINENPSCLARYLKLGKTEFKGHVCKYADQQPSQ